MTKRNIFISLALTLSIAFGGLVVAQPAFAGCAGANTSIINCEDPHGNELTGQDAIFKIIRDIITILTAGIGIVAVGAVIYGAFLYSSSGDNPENVKKAKDTWVNVVIGLVIFAFLVAITNFLIPGGVFN